MGEHSTATPASAVARRMQVLRADRGSGSALALAIISVTVALAITILPLLGAFTVHTRASVAADAAALAAADTASYRIPGDPCSRAGVVASLHETTLVDCSASHAESTVTVRAGLGWFAITATSRAGLPR